MGKQEFLEELKSALSGEVPAEVMLDSYRYYAGYIEERMAEGGEEEAVIEELGKPSLIARSIIAAQLGERVADEEYIEGGKSKRIKREYYTDRKESQKREHKDFRFDHTSWYAKILYLIIIILLVILVFYLLKSLFLIFITFGIPILIGLGIVYLLMYFFNEKK